MHVDLYEKIWIGAAIVMIAGFLGALVYGTTAHAIHPPSHIETVDPTTVRIKGDFAKPGVEILDDGSSKVIVLAELYRFLPQEIRVPASEPIRFRITSADVIHGFQVVGTNANVMAIPGYVTEFSLRLRPGKYLVVCNEYCGLSHHLMQGTLIAEGADATGGNKADDSSPGATGEGITQ